MCEHWRGGSLGGEEASVWRGDRMCREEALCVETGEEALCAGGGPLGGEETFCVGRKPSVWTPERRSSLQEALCMERRPSMQGGGHLCKKKTLCAEEASARRISPVQGGGPLCGEEVLCVGRRPSVL